MKIIAIKQITGLKHKQKFKFKNKKINKNDEQRIDLIAVKLKI